MIYVKDEKQIQGIKESAKILSEVFKGVRELLIPGTTLRDIDMWIKKEIERRGGKPAFLGYRGFPAATCISLNEEVVHGIPDERVLKEGDIVKIDSGVVYKGFYSDSAFTVFLGDEPGEDVKRLLEGTRRALSRAIDIIKEGIRLSDISHVIEETAKEYSLSVIKALGGHGVGLKLHEDPFVPNYGLPGRGPVLKEGMTLAIEPMFTTGSGEVKTGSDGWTIYTVDGEPAAHFEHTILVRKDGAEILTE
ncbi:MAG TPA: type I methionyl aminopeptidase [candidate division WOR-3 bacterium]|uniref:Methionine aminopeptidase n=1 Tax=candidate division WOR-3 bacterium TaxID=2052148 RepID=A0A7V0Q5B4_UNCW3|nr:type I methionyl aminopeptidase [candidate division WOR-3 bacterium]